MAKKKIDKLSEDSDIKPKKKGLFSFLRRKSKAKDDQSDAIGDKDELVEEAVDQKKPAPKKKAAAKRTTPKKTTSGKKPQAKETATENSEKAEPKKRRRSTKGKSAQASTAKAPAKKRGRPKKNDQETPVAAATTAEDVVEEPQKKKGIFGFLKRKKKIEKTDNQTTDIASSPADGDASSAELDPAGEGANGKKSRFFTKKIVFIFVALCGVSGASAAAAIVFAGPLLGNDPIKGLACKVAHKTNFELMKEKRVTAFIRSDLLPPKQRIEMLMKYTKFLEAEYAGANLFTVSMIDTDGPAMRSNFRGDNVGAQVVYAPDPLLSMATDTKWEVRYVNVSKTNGGRFMGDRFTLSEDEINEINSDDLIAADCYMDKSEEELEAEKLALEEATAEAEALTEAAENAHADGAASDEAVVDAEPGIIDKVLGMVGLGGDVHTTAEHVELGEEALPSTMADGGDHLQPYPGGPNADVMTHEKGFFDGILAMVGLGSSDEDMNKDTIPGVLGTRVKYH